MKEPRGTPAHAVLYVNPVNAVKLRYPIGSRQFGVRSGEPVDAQRTCDYFDFTPA